MYMCVRKHCNAVCSVQCAPSRSVGPLFITASSSVAVIFSSRFATTLRRAAKFRGSRDILRSRVIFGAALVWELLPTGDCRCLSSLKRSPLDYLLDFDVISHRTRVLLTLYWCFCIRLKRCKLISELVEASTNSSVYRLILFEFYLSKYQTDTKYMRWYICSTCRYNLL